MANFRPLFTTFITLLLHLGCFFIFPTSSHLPPPPRKPPRKPPSPAPFLRVSPAKLKRHKSISSSCTSFIKRLFSSKPDPVPETRPDPVPSTRPGSITGSDHWNENHESCEKCENYGNHESYEIHPCLNCGEVFRTRGLLEQHQSVKHALCELLDDDPGKNVVRILFGSGWPGKDPRIHRILKIHSSPKILARFEEYRERVKSTAARDDRSRRRDERCIADGNELLRFHCTTFLCELGQNGNSIICTHPYCSVCGIIGSGFSPKLDGVSTLSNSWRAHVAIPDDMEDEFRFMGVKRAMLVCRVIAGRVGCDPMLGDKDDPGYDSLVGREPGAVETRLDDDDELIVFNPWGVLPCFVIVYAL